MRATLVILLLIAVGCAGGSDAEEELFPDVLAAVVEAEPGGTFRVSATLSSPYDSPERYADAWRVLTPEGAVLGIRELAHDHGGEQSFTRSLSGVEIPDGVPEVIVEGRDQLSGWGGDTVSSVVPEPAN